MRAGTEISFPATGGRGRRQFSDDNPGDIPPPDKISWPERSATLLQEEFKKMLESGEAYKGKWNWAAFLFGSLWAMTKQLWLSVAICVVAGLITGGLAWVVYGFIHGIRENYTDCTLHAKTTNGEICETAGGTENQSTESMKNTKTHQTKNSKEVPA